MSFPHCRMEIRGYCPFDTPSYAILITIAIVDGMALIHLLKLHSI